MECGPQASSQLIRDSGCLWQVKLPQSLPFTILGLPKTANPDIADLGSPLLAEFIEVFLSTKLLLIETIYPEKYKPKHVTAPITLQKEKQTALKSESPIRNFNEILFAPYETTCCMEHFSDIEKYKLLCQILETYGYIISSKHPSECNGYEINLAYITTTEMMLTLTLIVMNSGLKHFEKKIVDKAKEFCIGVVGLRDIYDHVKLFNSYIANYQTMVEQSIVRHGAQYLGRQMIEDPEDAEYRMQIEGCWLLRHFRVIDQLVHPMAKIPFFPELRAKRLNKFVEETLGYVHQENTLVLVDIEDLTTVLGLYNKKGAKLRCLSPQSDFGLESITPAFNQLRLSSISSSSTHFVSSNPDQTAQFKNHGL